MLWTGEITELKSHTARPEDKSRLSVLNVEIVELTKTTEVYHVTFQPACSTATIVVGLAVLQKSNLIGAGRFTIRHR